MTISSCVAWQGELEFTGASETDSGGRMVRFRLLPAADDIGMAHPFSAFTRRRGKHAGTIFHAAITCVSDACSAYNDELMLASWADGPPGRTVAFWLPPDGGTHPFIGCRRATAGGPGTRFMAVLLEQGDDSAVVDQERMERAELVHITGHKQTLSNAVTIILKNPRFHDWLREYVALEDWGFDKADSWLKAELKINSKADLDDARNARSIAAWERIRKLFLDWQESQGEFMRQF